MKQVIVKDIPRGKEDLRKYKHNAIFSPKIPNIFACARRNSGKSVSIFTILMNMVDKNTEVVLFVATHQSDETYRIIKRELKKKKIKVTAYDSIFQMRENDKGKLTKHNVLLEYYNRFKKEAEDRGESGDEKEESEEEDESLDHMMRLMCPSQYKGKCKKKKMKKKKPKLLKDKRKVLTPKYVFVYDDASAFLKDPSITMFVKEHRHFKTVNILSSQYMLDIPPATRKQMTNFLLFKGHGDEKMEAIYKDIDVSSVDLPTFLDIYRHATEPKYSFLHIDVPTMRLQQRFEKVYE